MNHIFRCCFLFLFFFSFSHSDAQDSSVYKWKIISKKVSDKQYELQFTTEGAGGWQLYAPNQVIADVPSAELVFADSSIHAGNFIDSGTGKTIKSAIFDTDVRVHEGAVSWKQLIAFDDAAPGSLQGKLSYNYGKEDEFYSEAFEFSVALEGGVTSAARIKIAAIDVQNPLASCGDDDAADKSLMGIFFLGFLGGLIALITPCVFPLIPLTVSFFTKRSGSRKKGVTNALIYGFSIFIIYVILSLPFHIVDQVNPEVLNNISTNVWLNLAFFVVFVFFAFSFFGFYEIGLPSGFANKIDSRAGISHVWGIFFMALTLAIVSFSCTGPILGSLLAGALTNAGGATQLSFGMGGFGVGLALPFALFALFPGWLQSIPKSGGWLTTVKVVLGFLELALAVKFLSNADLVKQWGLLKREVFIAIWIIIGVAIVLYLLGVIRFKNETRPKISLGRWAFIVVFASITIYLLPGLSNSPRANLPLISGFPPPLSYSIYAREISFEPLKNDYEKALAMAREQNKPLLIDFTGWACVNCRRMEENVWIDPEVERKMKEDFVVVSLYVDERKKLPLTEQIVYTTKTGTEKPIITVGDKWASFQAENFNAVAQPQYAIIGTNEKILTKTKSYTPDPDEFNEWLECGLDAFRKSKK
ncbi:MAG TPA: cytochrome c biogenesis protein CcdA [Chitinophagaceae bacterium]|nr:cytochrome c biogenesis protein CcdA [Chitinophagaceae bacterium]